MKPVSPPVEATPALLPGLVARALLGAPTPLEAALDTVSQLAWDAITLGERAVGVAAHDPSCAPPLQLPVLLSDATARLAAVTPTGARWPSAFARAWAEHARVLARRAVAPEERATEHHLGPLCALALCAAEGAGRPDLVPALAPLLDRAARLYLALRAPRSHAGDVAADRALVEAWRALGFAAIAARIDAWSAALAALPCAAPPPRRTARTLEAALRAGRAFLDDAAQADEADEVYRWGFLEVSPLASTVFPRGTVLENRVRAGESRPYEVDALLERYAANRFHYFDQRTALPFDTDTFGLMARLTRAASDPGAARRALDVPLRWVLENVSGEGDVPVFLTRGVDAGDGRRYIATLGNACAGVQANLLLGLLALAGADEALDGGIERVGAGLAMRFAERGAAGLGHYEALYGAHLVDQALAAWAATARGSRRAERAAPARAQAAALIARAAAQAHPTALERAWRGLAGHADDTWLEPLLCAQEADGGWPAAPFYRVPSRGNHGESHGSRRITTSFACCALARAGASR